MKSPRNIVLNLIVALHQHLSTPPTPAARTRVQTAPNPVEMVAHATCSASPVGGLRIRGTVIEGGSQSPNAS